MNKGQETKALICKKLRTMLDGKLEETQSAIRSIKESRDNDSKSSAGDKHETSRAMAQIELDKLEVQLAKMIVTRNILVGINSQRPKQKVVPMAVGIGSLVTTNQGNYFISIGIGKVEIDSSVYFAISLDSPIGEVLKGKVVGNQVVFQGKTFVIKDIV